ncbi:MAG: T9SS type A sorting domain-containing protein [Bacteroidia bacterium]
MKAFYIFLFALLPLSSFAQPTVSLCLENTGSALELRIQPDAAFSGFVANIQFSIKVDDPSVTFGTPTGILTYIPMAKAGTETVSGGSTYQRFAGFGTLALSSLGTSWAAGDLITLFSIVPSDLTASYSIAIDSWTTDNNGAYYVELDAIDKTGATSVCSSTLPVEGLSLAAKIVSTSSVQLDWQSLSESGNDHYVIEKSSDQGTFEAIGKVKAVGNSQTISSYQFLDQSPMGRENQYRIKQVDQNGSFSYSNLERVEWDFVYVGVLYPNPSRERSYLSLRLIEDSQIQLRLYNSTGQLVQQIKRSAGPGSQEIALDIAGLARGIYTFALSVNGKNHASQRLMIQ